MKRRTFIKSTAAGLASIAIAPSILRGKPDYKTYDNNELFSDDDDNIMIIIELFGGNDGLNTIIPYEQEDEYRRLRTNLFIPQEHSTRYGTSDLYLNSALVDDVHNDGFLRLLDEGRLAIVQGIGYDAPTQSHFRSRDIWHSGINSSDPNEKLLEGWIGRYVASKLTNYPDGIPEHPIAIALGSSVPLLFKSNIGHMGIALNSPETFSTLGKGLTPKINRYNVPENTNNEKEFNFIHVIASQSELYSKAVFDAFQNGKDKPTINYSQGLSQRFKLISQLISGGLKTKIYYVNLSNFDSHAQQMQSDYKGAHATLLSRLAGAVSEFLDDAVRQGFHKRITGLTISEFGRRAYDNGSRGTDHGAGSMQFVFGGSDENIEGGYYRVDGKPDLYDLDQYGNIRHDYDFRRIYADFLETWLGAEKQDTLNTFGEQFLPLGILKSRKTSVRNAIPGMSSINVSPNPSFGHSVLTIEILKAGLAEISIYSIEGREVLKLHQGFIEPGIYNFNININNTGRYIANAILGHSRTTYPFIVIK
ncbi:MAG: DUF1501 domain-containing protein [Candidatus Kapabacteria bacterium]|nr:DUF1501 domain-containing protein [Ignavibacteriota bacterium]MCW5884907.1 DUF1501 domain-containing protein [Candidatus Kapabacteria bacterium]